MLRRLMVICAATAVAVSGLVTQPGHAAPKPRGAECNVSGSATISPGLGVKAKPQTITLSPVSLTDCRIGSTAAPGVPTTITGSATISPNPASSKAGCANGSLKNLTANISFSTGTTARAVFSTTSVTGETVITGNITASTDPALKPGDTVAGNVVFRPTTTAQNCAVTPVTAVTYTGVIAAGWIK